MPHHVPSLCPANAPKTLTSMFPISSMSPSYVPYFPSYVPLYPMPLSPLLSNPYVLCLFLSPMSSTYSPISYVPMSSPMLPMYHVPLCLIICPSMSLPYPQYPICVLSLCPSMSLLQWPFPVSLPMSLLVPHVPSHVSPMSPSDWLRLPINQPVRGGVQPNIICICLCSPPCQIIFVVLEWCHLHKS